MDITVVVYPSENRGRTEIRSDSRWKAGSTVKSLCKDIGEPRHCKLSSGKAFASLDVFENKTELPVKPAVVTKKAQKKALQNPMTNWKLTEVSDNTQNMGRRIFSFYTDLLTVIVKIKE